MKSLYHLYLVECADSSIYCGITTDVDRRVKEHNAGRRGAKYTRSRRPVRFLASWPVCCVSCALKTERCVKKLSRAKKLDLITKQESFNLLCKACPDRLVLIHGEQTGPINNKQEKEDKNE